MLRILIVGLVLLIAVLFVLPRPGVPAPENATEYAEPLALPAVRLTDHAGRAFVSSDLEGRRYSLLFFGFTHCPDICPLTLKVLADSMALMRDRGQEPPRVVLVSVDPARDTPERLTEYLASFDASFTGLTGANNAVQPWLETLGITVMREELAGDNYNMVHNSQVFVLSPDAELIAIMSSADDPTVVATDYARIVYRHEHDVDVSRTGL
jgi:protein SCO1/2